MSEQEASERLAWPSSLTGTHNIEPPWLRNVAYEVMHEEKQGEWLNQTVQGKARYKILYCPEMDTSLSVECTPGSEGDVSVPVGNQEIQGLLEILQAASIPRECYAEVLRVWTKAPVRLRLSFRRSVTDFNQTMTEITAGVEALRQLANNSSWPPSRQEMHEWLSGLDIGLFRVALRFYLQALAMFVDAQAHGQRRLQGRGHMKEVNHTKRVPEALKDAWRQRAQELRRKHGKKSWSIAGQIARDETLNPMGRWTQRAIYNHIRSIFPSSRIS